MTDDEDTEVGPPPTFTELRNRHTIIGVPAPLPLPADKPMAQTREFLTSLGAKMGIVREPDDTIVVDVEVNEAGQIEIVGAERVP